MQKKVYFYATCLGNSIYTDTVVSAVKLLQREGVEVIFKKDQTCCGQPSFNTGYFGETKKIALFNMNLFKEDYPVIVPSGSCAGVMSHDYIDLFKGTEYAQKAKEFASRVYELGEYLDKYLNVEYQDRGEQVAITWHTNCHALRVKKTIDSSKNLLKRFKNVDIVELEHEEECCGFGGTFSVKEHDISYALTSKKIEDIEKTGVKYLVSGDGGCLLSISGTLEKFGKTDIKVVHLYDFLLKRLEGDRL